MPRNSGTTSSYTRTSPHTTQRRQGRSARAITSGPFVDRTALLLDPSLMEQARRAAGKFQMELNTAADRVLRGIFFAPPCQLIPRRLPKCYGRASRTMLNGVSAARRTRVNPAACKIFERRPSPACAPSPNPTSCDREAGVQSIVEAA